MPVLNFNKDIIFKSSKINLNKTSNIDNKIVVYKGPEYDTLNSSQKDFISSKVIFKSGRCTGKVKQPHALGEGKLELVKKYCKDSNFSLNNACFYSDSKNDLPLLEAVNMPIAVNPDKNLKNIAKSKNWMIINN